jgi:hypothetical protein
MLRHAPHRQACTQSDCLAALDQTFPQTKFFHTLASTFNDSPDMTRHTLASLMQLANQAPSSFEQEFRELHHFSKTEFSSNPSSLSAFVTYCQSLVDGIKPNEENEQTIQRAYLYLELIAKGSASNNALNAAWEAFPILTRP